MDSRDGLPPGFSPSAVNRAIDQPFRKLVGCFERCRIQVAENFASDYVVTVSVVETLPPFKLALMVTDV